MLAAYRFSFKGPGRTADTFPFYNKNILGFLRWHHGQVVWVVGAKVKKEAYMLMTDNITLNFENMMKTVTRGQWAFWKMDPFRILHEIEEHERHTKGYLHYSNKEIGHSDENFCPKEHFKEVSVKVDCEGSEYEKACEYWQRWHCGWTWEKQRELALGRIQVQREQVRDFLTQQDANNWISERRKKGDHDQYVTEPRTDSPTGETYYRLYRVIRTIR